jgi:asparagine synthase (glutamine-hydrolysing)
MCGINGLFGLETISDPRSSVDRMNNALAHRGPDASGVEVLSNACLGHRRLSIIDLSPSADQPMTDSSGRYTMVFNGEVYNFQSVKEKLPDYPFTTSSDSEVVLAAYAEWGSAALQWFNGMFALAIWDAEEQEMFIARDRIGIKPLYYSFQKGTLIFSSEIKALLASELVTPKLDRRSLLEYLTYQTVHDPGTMLEDVRMLPAGHYMVLRDEDHEVVKYWDAAHSVKDSSRMTEVQVQSKINDLLHESVERRLISDVPFGAFLSGGIDSSAMVGLMSEVSTTQLSTFSVTFDDSEFSEAKYARIVAEKFKTAHHEIQLSPDDFLGLLPDALNAMDHPSGDGPNTYVVSKVTKEAGITVAISGMGGDELFAGYPHFIHCHSAMDKKWVSQYPMALRKLVSPVIRALKPGIPGKKLAKIITSQRMDLPHLYPIMRQVLMNDEVSALLGGDTCHNVMHERLLSYQETWSRLPKLSQISMAEMDTYMRNVLLRDTDQMGMAHALEVRVPFLDHELIEFILGVSDEFKFPSTPKSLLVDSLSGLLPREIINRPKMGFTLPWVHWMRNELREFCESHLEALKGRGILDPEAMDTLWKRFLNNDNEITWSRVWHLVVLEKWMQNHDVQT